jgi:hypothetical protein
MWEFKLFSDSDVHLSLPDGAHVTAPRVKDGQSKQLNTDIKLQQFNL